MNTGRRSAGTVNYDLLGDLEGTGLSKAFMEKLKAVADSMTVDKMADVPEGWTEVSKESLVFKGEHVYIQCRRVKGDGKTGLAVWLVTYISTQKDGKTGEWELVPKVLADAGYEDAGQIVYQVGVSEAVKVIKRYVENLLRPWASLCSLMMLPMNDVEGLYYLGVFNPKEVVFQVLPITPSSIKVIESFIEEFWEGGGGGKVVKAEDFFFIDSGDRLEKLIKSLETGRAEVLTRKEAEDLDGSLDRFNWAIRGKLARGEKKKILVIEEDMRRATFH